MSACCLSRHKFEIFPMFVLVSHVRRSTHTRTRTLSNCQSRSATPCFISYGKFMHTQPTTQHWNHSLVSYNHTTVPDTAKVVEISSPAAGTSNHIKFRMYSIHPKAATAAKSPFFKRPESSNTSASSTGSEQGHQGLKNMNECDQKVVTEGLEERKAFAEQQNFAFALSSPEIRQRRGRNNSGGSPNLSHHSTSPSSWTSPSETGDHDDCSNSMAVILKHDPESGGDNIEVSIDADDEASFLHSVCRNASRVTDLQIAIGHVTVDAASLADQHGQTPLHVLSMNKTLAQTTTSVHMGLLAGQSSSSKILYSPTSLQRAYSHGSSTTAASMSTEQVKSDESALASFIVDVLFRAYPAAMISTDAKGFIPFESSLHEWVESCYALAKSRPNSSTRSLNTSENQLSTLLPTLWDLKDTVASRWATATGQGYQHQNNSKNSLARGGLQSQDSLDIEQGFTGVTEGMQSRQQIFPNNVRVSAHMLSSLHMLSALLDALDTISEQLAETGIRETTSSSRRRSKRAVDALNNITIQDISTSIVETVASIPDLVKTILFIGNDEQKNHCIGTTLMQRVLRCKESVGGWLTGMLQSHKKKPSNLAIEYLHIISSSSVANPERESSEIDSRINGLGRHPPSEEMNDFCQAISQLPDFVPSLLSLGDRQMEDAATTKVVQKVLDLFISRPFVVTVVFCDALFLSVLIGGYRGAVSGLLLGASPSAVLRYIYLANVGIFYFVIRETGKAISLCMITGRARVYFLSFWNLSDMLSTILSLTSLIIIRSTMESPDYGMIRNICTVTTGLLWLRVLSFLKGINIMLATFVLAIIQISRDILWFCVILFTFVVSFAQMFFTLLAPSTCMEENVNTKDCTPSEYYVSLYRV